MKNHIEHIPLHDAQYASIGGQTDRAGRLPCLYSGISIENAQNPQNYCAKTEFQLNPHGRKTAFVLTETVHSLSQRFGLSFLGFLTLTFAQNIRCPREAQRRLNSLLSNVINKRYRSYVAVMERQKSGRIHYHLLVVLNFDARTGFDFSGIARCDYSSACAELRSEWSFWRSTAKKYGFGRTELLPVKSSSDAIAKYVGKYISKHTENRLREDKGVRLVRYAKNARIGTTRFQFFTDGSRQWRDKCAVFAQMLSARFETEITQDNIADYLGPRWAYNNKDFILSLP